MGLIFYRVYLYDKLDQVADPIIGIGPTARPMLDHYIPIRFDTIGKDTCRQSESYLNSFENST